MLEISPLSTNRALYLVGGVGEYGRIHSGFYYVSFFFYILHLKQGGMVRSATARFSKRGKYFFFKS